MNSSIACPYDSWELAAASEFRTAFFDCSKSGSRSIDLALARLVVFPRCPILAASRAALSMVIHLECLRTRTPFLGNFRFADEPDGIAYRSAFLWLRNNIGRLLRFRISACQ